MSKQTDIKKNIQKNITQEAPWLNLKGYSHFDRPISFINLKQDKNDKNPHKLKLTKESQQKLNDRITSITNIVSNAKEVAEHSFYPFIGFDIIERRGSIINKIKYYEEKIKSTDDESRKKDFEKELEKLKEKGLLKKRPIRYASHVDGYIYSYYTKLLYEKYEQKLNKLGLVNEILAYRRLPEDDDGLRPNNCTMANDVFKEIKARNSNCLAYAFDISSFYDCIDHSNLKTEWCNVLGEKQLPEDHYNIFKSLTNYCYVDLKEVCFYFNNKGSDYCSLECCNRCKKRINQQIPKFPFEKASEFRKFRKWYKQKLGFTFHKNKGAKEAKPYGIPQGSAMSALLSNMYMIPFDVKIKKLADEIGGVYRRYSDDILFICDPKYKEQVKKEIMAAIEARGAHLIIHPIEDWNKYSKSQCYDFTSDKIKQQPLQYLGFLFDGERVRIRDGSLARYMRKSKRGVTASKKNALKKLNNMHKKGIKIEEKHKKLYRKTLYTRYTHKGKRNFISYAYRAFENFDDKTIKKQVRNHFARLNKMIKSADSEIAKECEELLELK